MATKYVENTISAKFIYTEFDNLPQNIPFKFDTLDPLNYRVIILFTKTVDSTDSFHGNRTSMQDDFQIFNKYLSRYLHNEHTH